MINLKLIALKFAVSLEEYLCGVNMAYIVKLGQLKLNIIK